MARNKKWTIPFKSLSGTDCRIDIYKEGYSGAVTTISPENANTPGWAAADPIDWQETDDDSLLEVLRYKTGYIRLIEKTIGSLIDMFPQTNTDHYVEFYYGTVLKFTGYIQSQSFDNDFIAAPREINLPIISPLGVAKGLRMQTITPANMTIGALLHNCITQLNAGYTHVLFPFVSPHFAGVIKSIIPIPFNNNFDYLESGANDVYDPHYISEFIEGICNAYGWMVHDEPEALVFTKFLHVGSYNKIWLAGLDNGSPSSEVTTGAVQVNFSDYFSIAGDDGTVKTLLPLNQLTIDYGDEPFVIDSYDFQRLSFQKKDTVSSVVAVWMKPYGPELMDTDDDNTMTAFDSLQNHGVNVCAVGRLGKPKKMILIYKNAQSRNEYLFTCRLYKIPKADANGIYTFKIDGVVGKDLYFEDNDMSNIVGCSIMAGTKYLTYDSSAYQASTWGDTLVINNVWIGISNMAPITVSYLPPCDYIEIKFYSYPLVDDAKFIGITDIGITKNTDGAVDWDASQTTDKNLRVQTGTDEKGTVSMMFTGQRAFVNQIGTTIFSAQTDYSYMFVTQTVLRVKVKQISAYTYPYFVRWAYWQTGWNWRIVSISFEPWNDDYIIILHRSSTLN